MIITSKINMDLIRQDHPAAVSAVQDDRYSRNLEISLQANGIPWNIPENAGILIRYSKADGKGGEYDTLPDGSTAWSAEENLLTVALAPQVLTVPGPVRLAISLILEEKQLSTFTILMNVHPNVHALIHESEDYAHVTAFLPAPASAEKGQYFRVASVDASGKVTAVEAVNQAPGGSGADADLTGYATEDWVRKGYQPKGNYLTEHQDISGKLDADRLPEAIEDALAQAKASGDFDGENGITPELLIYPIVENTSAPNTATRHGVCIKGPDIINEDGSFLCNEATVYDGLDGKPGVYTLANGETIADAPDWAQVVVDPNNDPSAVEMIATLDDGTTVSCRLYGEVVTG